MVAGLRAGLLALGLAGCAAVPPASAPLDVDAWPDRWALQGRIGVQHGETSLAGQLHWRHAPDSDELLLTSPLGQGMARIVRDGDGVALELPEQPVRRAADLDALTRDALGYELPVGGLRWWLQARPDPARSHQLQRGTDGRVSQLKQDGWTIDYTQYVAEPMLRPRKLVVSREGLEIRLVADRWQAE
jgi:outer membrane lipoprotein LolB